MSATKQPKAARRERPILMSDAMVRAILDGRKTVTRRMIGLDTLTGSETRGYDWTWRGQAPVRSIAQQRRHPCGCWQDMRDADFRALCPYGVPGDLLYVREAWQGWTRTSYENDEWDIWEPSDIQPDPDATEYRATSKSRPPRWRPSIHLPKRLARLWLEVVSVRAERLQEITEEDAARERVDWAHKSSLTPSPLAEFARLWDALNGKRPGASWSDNPFVWRVEFRRVER